MFLVAPLFSLKLLCSLGQELSRPPSKKVGAPETGRYGRAGHSFLQASYGPKGRGSNVYFRLYFSFSRCYVVIGHLSSTIWSSVLMFLCNYIVVQSVIWLHVWMKCKFTAPEAHLTFPILSFFTLPILVFLTSLVNAGLGGVWGWETEAIAPRRALGMP